MRMPRDTWYLVGVAVSVVGFLVTVWFEVDFHPRRAIAALLVMVLGITLAAARMDVMKQRGGGG